MAATPRHFLSEFSGMKFIHAPTGLCVDQTNGVFDGINIQQYSIREEPIVGEAKEEVQNYDLMSAVMICLGEETGKNYGGLLP